MSAIRFVLLSTLLALSPAALHASGELVIAVSPDAATAPRSPLWQQIDPLLDQSIAALIAGDTETAEKARTAALKLSGFQGDFPVPPADVLVAHAERAIKVNHTDAAILDYSEALQGSRRTDHRLALARLLVARNRPDEASAPLTEIFRSAPEYGPAQLLLGQLQLARYQRDSQLSDLAAASLTLAPPTRSAATVLTPEWEKSLNDLNAALRKLTPADQTALTQERKKLRLARANTLLADHDNDEALPILNALIAEDPRLIEAYELRIKVSDYARERNTTDQQIINELRASPPQVPAATDTNADAVALAQAALLIHADPHDPHAYFERVKTRIYLQNPTLAQAEAAVADARLACDLDPDDPDAFLALCEALLAQQRLIPFIDAASLTQWDHLKKQALVYADRVLELAPTQIHYLVWRAQKQRDAGPHTNDQNSAQALLFLNRALAAAPANLSALSARAAAANQLENYPLAIADYQELIRLQPTVPVYWYNLGWVYMNAEKFRAAATAFAASAGGENVPDDAPSLQALMLAFAGDDSAEKLAAAIPEHSVYASGLGTAAWNTGHNKGYKSPLIDRVLAQLQKARR